MIKPKILILTTIWGHRSMALGAFDLIKAQGFDVVLEEIAIDPFSAQSYKAFYRFLPTFFKTFFELSKTKIGGKAVHKYLYYRYSDIITESIKKNKPDIVISAYFGFDSTIEKLIKRYQFEYFNIISDPWTFSRVVVSKKGINLVFDEHAFNKIKHLLPRSIDIKTGWFVQEKYYKEMDKSEARKILKIDKNTFTICAAGGSEGTFEILKIISSLVGKGRSVQILLMCGDNKQLYELTKSLSKVVSKTKKVNIIPYKFTDHMELFYKASDLVIGKAGPNTIFECVASKVPFFAITHIHGQEDGNLSLIKKYQIGYVEEKLIPAANKIKKIIDNPKILNKFDKPISDLNSYNLEANQKFLEVISTKKN